MDPKTVRLLEAKLQEAINEEFMRMDVERLPLLPSHHTTHMMAKAAVAVYEAVVQDEDLRARE